ISAEKELKESEEKYRTLVENVNIGIFRSPIELDGTIIHANLELARMLGYDNFEDNQDIRVVDIYMNPDERRVFLEELEKEGFIQHREFHLQKKDGSHFWAEVSARIVEDDDKNARWIDGVLIDKTKKKLTEIMLEETKERLLTVMNNVPVVFWTVNEDGIIVLSEGKGLEAMGVKPGELVGSQIFELFKDYPEIIRHVRESLSGTPIFATEQYGELFFDTVYSPTKDETGAVTGVIAICTDITKRISAESELKDSEENYKNLFDLANDAIMILEPVNEVILEANTKALDIYGFSREEFIGRSIRGIIKNVEARQAIISDLLKSRQFVNFETTHFDKNGNQIDFLINASLISFNKKEAILCINRDITEHKRLLEQLNRAKQMESLGKLAGSVAHDINHILTGLVTYPDLILMDLDKDDPFREKIEAIKKSGQRAAAVVDDLLTIARGEITIPESLNINDMIFECIKSPEIRQLLEENSGITVDTQLEPFLYSASLSKVKITKILNNVIINAIDAMPEGGRLLLSTANKHLEEPLKSFDDILPGDYVVLSVSDTGIGIPEENIPYIFDPYFTKKVLGRSGSGIGLTIVWNILKDYNGFIDVKSEAGIGTVFHLYFPSSEKIIREDDKSLDLAEFLGKGESVLVVDDEEIQREVCLDMLKKLNYTAAAVPSGEEAIEYVKKSGVDILVLDMILGTDLDGLDTFREIKKTYPDQKAIIITGYSASERIKEAQEIGAGELVSKPCTMRQMGTALRNELDR
ncbi:PAS domain S-box protein, partial [candidate division KSB1 bacterium]